MAVIDNNNNNPRNIFDLVAETASKINPLDPNSAAKLAGLFNNNKRKPEFNPNNQRMSFAISNSMESLAKQPNQKTPSKLSLTGSHRKIEF